MLVQRPCSASSGIQELVRSAHTARPHCKPNAVAWPAKLQYSRKRQETCSCLNSSSVQGYLAPVLQSWQLAASLGLAGLYLYHERPRGWCNNALVQVIAQLGAGNCLFESHCILSIMVQVTESQVAGYGVFAVQPIPHGAVVGGYPGLPRTAKGMLAKAMRVPQCQQYVFQISSNLWLDPTDSTGSPSSKLLAFIPFWRTDISMAYVNEPPVGQTVNVEISDAADSNSPDLQFVATQSIDPGEELFIDYGSVYNRSNYNTE